MADLEWTNDLVIRLVQEYKARPELWDSSHEMYRVHSLKYETWKELADMFECDIADLRKKLNSVFASHRREKAKVRAGARTTWFLYSYMNFLPTHVEENTSDTAENNISIVIPTEVKRQKNVKEMAMTSEEDDDNEQDMDNDDDHTIIQEEVLIKTEPVQTYIKPRIRYHSTHKPRISRPVKRRVVKELSNNRSNRSRRSPEPHQSHQLDSRLSEALKLLKRSDLTRRKDSCDSFGEYIADSLRKHDDRTQSMIKQAINNILFEQEMKKYSANNQYTVVISGVDENPLILDGSDK